MRNRSWDDEKLSQVVAESKSITEVIRSLKLSSSGNMNRNMKGHIARLGLSTEHWYRHGNCTRETPLEDILVKNSTYLGNNQRIKKKLMDAGILEDICSECALGTEWNGKDITLVVDHINGIRNDHRIENLRILCPNCHSQTETFGSKNISYRRNNEQD